MSLINNRNEESLPEFEVISGGKEDIRSSFADRTEEETEIDLIDLAWALLDKIHYIVLCFLIGAVHIPIFLSVRLISQQRRCMLYLHLRIQ